MKKNQLLTIIGGVAATTLALLPNIASAWGPADRPTYTNDKPADYATFNSIIDNVAVGDERNFVRVKEIGTNTPYQDKVKVTPGKEYEVYIYYHNDAGSDTNPTGFGMATETVLSSTYPTYLSKGKDGTITGTITWNYVTPANPKNPQTGKVWDEAYLETDYDNVVMKYKPATAIIHNGGEANGAGLSTNLFTSTGIYIGYNVLKGVIPGCAEYSGYITYTLVAEKTDSSLEKKVSLDGENWSEKVNVKPGDTVLYNVKFRNTGNTNLTNVIMKDSHDNGLTLISGSTIIFDDNNIDGLVIGEILDTSGYNFGDAGVKALRQILYQAQVADDKSLCGKTLKNTISVRYNSEDQKSDDALVYVYCEETPPEPTCETDPTMEGCEQPTCETNPEMDGCKEPEPEPEKNCKTNPEMEGCKELPNTGPLEIVMAILIVLGIGGGGYYFYRSRKNLGKAEKKAKGQDLDKKPEDTPKPETPKQV